jgi:oxalate decarboxylase/phosphoglucose isomerase-like protein (cupin superfamily)
MTRYHKSMAATDHLGQQFDTVFNADYHGRHAVTVWPSGQVGTEYDKPVGSLHWHPEQGSVTYLNVDEGSRRQGVATSMWHSARNQAAAHGLTPPVHSSSQSEDGTQWARSLGD